MKKVAAFVYLTIFCFASASVNFAQSRNKQPVSEGVKANKRPAQTTPIPNAQGESSTIPETTNEATRNEQATKKRRRNFENRH